MTKTLPVITFGKLASVMPMPHLLDVQTRSRLMSVRALSPSGDSRALNERVCTSSRCGIGMTEASFPNVITGNVLFIPRPHAAQRAPGPNPSADRTGIGRSSTANQL